MIAWWLELAVLLAPADATIERDVRTAIEQPASYLQAHEVTSGRLGSSKQPAGDRHLPWLALVDELIARHCAVELDWRVDKDDLLWSLEQLQGYPQLSATTRASIAELRNDDALTVNWLRAVAGQTAHDGMIIAVMDIDSDSYVTLLLKHDDYHRAAQLARRLGFVLADIREHDPNA